MKLYFTNYWNLGFGLLLIIQAYALYFMKYIVDLRIIQLVSICALGLVFVVIGAHPIKKKTQQATTSLDN